MTSAYENPFANTARQLAQSTLEANTLAFEAFERIVNLHLKSADSSVKSSAAFLAETSEISDLASVQAIWPKGTAFVKESSEQLYSTTHQVMNEALLTTDAINQLFRTPFQAVSDALTKAQSKTHGVD